ncbi:hypothetical protein, partial [Bacillus cereus]
AIITMFITAFHTATIIIVFITALRTVAIITMFITAFHTATIIIVFITALRTAAIITMFITAFHAGIIGMFLEVLRIMTIVNTIFVIMYF